MLNPSATVAGLSQYLWKLEQPAHAVANGYFVDPRGQFVGDVGDAHDEELIVRDLDLDKIAEVRNTWQFFRDRRPDAYADLTRP